MRWFFRDLHLKLMAFMLAFALYAFVNSESVVEEPYTVELKLGVLPPDHVLVSELPSINVTVRGTSRAFSTLSSDQIRTLTMNALRPGDVSYQVRASDFHLPTGLTVTGINPDNFAVRIEELVRTELPVQVNIGGHAQAGFEITGTRVDPNVVYVDMPASYSPDGVTVFTEPVDVDGLNAPYVQEVGLVFLRQYVTPAPGQHFEVSVDVRQAEVDRQVEAVEVFVTGPTQRWEVTVLESSLSVSLRGSSSALEALDPARLFAEVNLSDIDESDLPANVVVTPVLHNLPESVRVVSVVPHDVRVSIEALPQPTSVLPAPVPVLPGPDGLFPLE